MSDYQIDAVSKEEWYECAWRDARDECDRINYVVKEMNASADIMRERLDASLDEITRLRADLAAAREQVAGAWAEGRDAAAKAAHEARGLKLSQLEAIGRLTPPQDATAALDARIQRERAEERERIREIIRKCADDGPISYGAATWLLDAIYAADSRKAGGK